MWRASRAPRDPGTCPELPAEEGVQIRGPQHTAAESSHDTNRKESPGVVLSWHTMDLFCKPEQGRTHRGQPGGRAAVITKILEEDVVVSTA